LYVLRPIDSRAARAASSETRGSRGISIMHRGAMFAVDTGDEIGTIIATASVSRQMRDPYARRERFRGPSSSNRPRNALADGRVALFRGESISKPRHTDPLVDQSAPSIALTDLATGRYWRAASSFLSLGRRKTRSVRSSRLRSARNVSPMCAGPSIIR